MDDEEDVSWSPLSVALYVIAVAAIAALFVWSALYLP